jgi:hypothetical protein
MIVLTLPLYVGYGLRSAYLIAHPEIEPYFSRAWLVIMRDGIAALVAFWIAFLLFGWLERRRSGPHTPYALVGVGREAAVEFPDQCPQGVFALGRESQKMPRPLHRRGYRLSGAELLG